MFLKKKKKNRNNKNPKKIYYFNSYDTEKDDIESRFDSLLLFFSTLLE